ncbi:MATE family efflux transporter [Bradyrhizobium arachidis]|uniref:MATE family efflux transporter n=1 Tax=Bradyrhizobium arachidis TaxID=858423 RepID=UPI0021623C4E|nr:MATE family efflux transporter [Bradyrhizobium arachidis]UVO30216.1 MATE family efflux transporter [Bradyrhizobium arachidis]
MNKRAEKAVLAIQFKRTTPSPYHQLAIELAELAKLSWPMVLTQLGQVVMMTTDLALIGRVDPEALAASALAITIYLVGFTLGVGLLTPIAPLAAQAFGAKNRAAVRRTLRMGLWAALLLSVPIMAFGLQGEQVLLAFGQAPEMARLAQQYLFGLVWGAAPALWFHGFRNFMAAVHRPQPVLWIAIGAIPLNALVAYVLIYGMLGLPPLGLFGAGLASSFVNLTMFLAVLWFATMRLPFRDYHVLARLWQFDWPFMRRLIAMGIPIALIVLLEYGLFSAAGLLAGLVSIRALTAHQIALQVDLVLFVVPLGISTAAAVRVGHAVGRSDGPGVKRAGLIAILLGTIAAAILTIVVVAVRFEIARLFLDGTTDGVGATTDLAANLLLVGASFFISDAAQHIAAGGLRGLKDTRVPLLFACIANWPIGFTLSYVLGLKIGLGAIGIWIGLSIGTSIYAGLLVVRFLLLASKFAPQRCPASS